MTSAVRCEARFLLRFVNDIIDAGAVLFGGAPRDLILAKHHESQYFAAGGTDEDFDDTTTHLPEWSDRGLIPNDIDAYIYDDDFALLELNWSRLHMQKVSRVVVQSSTYLNMPDSATHYKYVLSIANREYFNSNLMLAGFHPDLRALVSDCVHRFTADMKVRMAGCRSQVRLDLLVIPRGTPLLLCHDFNVNGLCMDGRGVWLSPGLAKGLAPLDTHLALQDVLTDVRAKRAKYLGWEDVTNFRLRKLLEKGWTVPLSLVQAVEGGAPYEGHCIVCHERFVKNKETETVEQPSAVEAKHYKLRCCDARYHASCLMDAAFAKMCASGHCLLCSRTLNAKALFVDGTILHPGDSVSEYPGRDNGEDEVE